MEQQPEIIFTDIFNLEEIQQLQDLFADAFGVASIITNTDGTPITEASNFCNLCNNIIRKTEKGRANCFKSDALLGQPSLNGPTIQPCLSSGLWDAGTSIIVDGKHIANWLIGQIRNEEIDIQRLIRYADEIGANKDEFVSALQDVTVMSLEQFKKVSNMLYAFANQITEKAYRNLQLNRFINDQKHSNKLLKESEELYKSILNASPDDITITDLEGNIKMLSPSGAVMFGYDDPNKIIGHNVIEFITLEEQERALNDITNLINGEKLNSLVYNALKADGSSFYVEINVDVIKNIDQQPIGLVIIIRNITEWKLAQQKLQESEEKYRLLFQNLSIGFALHEAILDANGNPCDYRFLEMNPAFEQLTGLSINSIKGKTCLDVLPETEPFWIETYGKVALTGQSIDFENYSHTMKRYYQVTAYSPEPMKFATIFIDITERKLVQQKIQESEEKYRELVENLPDAITIYIDGKVVFANGQSVTLMRAKNKDELIGRAVILSVHPDYRALVIERMKKVAVDNIALPSTHEKFIRLDGSSVDVEVRAIPINFEGKKAVQLIIRDISERLESENKLIEKMNELQRFHNLSVNRELTMIELKKEINDLLKQSGQEEKYKIVGG